MLTLESRVDGDCAILEASGEFTSHQCGRFLNMVRQEVRPGIRKVIVDASRLEHMTASALAELAEIHCILAESGCRLILVGLTSQVHKMLFISSLDKIIATVPTVKDALALE